MRPITFVSERGRVYTEKQVKPLVRKMLRERCRAGIVDPKTIRDAVNDAFGDPDWVRCRNGQTPGALARDIKREFLEDVTWTTIRFLRTRDLPRYRVFERETWVTYRPVGDEFELGGGLLVRGRDFTVLYEGPDRDTAFEAHDTHSTAESRAYHGLPATEAS